MKVVFDQYQRYKNAQLVINDFRRENEKFRILEVGANEHKDLEQFLPDDEIMYLDIQLSEEKQKDRQYIWGDATCMDFNDNEFDIIVALDVYEHIFPDRRTAFLNELGRVARVGFVISAPFADEKGEVHRAEERMNEAYRVLYGGPHPWLLEHLENGLPDLEWTRQMLDNMGIQYEIFCHGGLRTWEQMMYMQIMADYDTNLGGYFATISEYYNENLFSNDYLKDSYRKFVVGDKQNRGIHFERKGVEQDQKFEYLSKVFLTLLDNVKLSRILGLTSQICQDGRMNIIVNSVQAANERLCNIENVLEKLPKAEECYAGLYSDVGDGFQVDSIDKISIKGNKAILKWKIPVGKRIKAFRLDPVNTSALLKINCIRVTDADGNKRDLTEGDLNGCTQGMDYLYKNYFLANCDDPQIYIRNDNYYTEIYADFEIYQIEKNAAHTINTLIDEIKEDIFRPYQNFPAEKHGLEMQCSLLQGEVTQAKQEKAKLQQELAQCRDIYKATTESVSWKVTAPARFVGDVFSQHLISRAIQCVKDNGLEYTIDLYKKGGYDKGDISRATKEVLATGEKEKQPTDAYKGKIIDFFQIKEDELERQKKYKFPLNIKFSILVPLYNTDEGFLREMIESAQYQTYQNWELCLADGSDSEHEEVGKICLEYAKKDSRILYKKLEKNEGISGNTNACIDMASGDYISLFDHDDILYPCALFETMKAITEHQADYVYTDEATFEGRNISHIITRHCKPDFAIDNLRANNYICHFSSFKKELLDKAGRFRSDYDGSQDHDLILRLTEAAEHVYHIPKILYYWRSHAKSVAQDINAKTYAIDAAKRAVESHLKRQGLEAELLSTRAFPTIFQINYKIIGHPKISIIIPNKDHVEDLSRCLISIMTKSSYDNYEIIVVENNSTKPETMAYYKMIESMEQVKVLFYKGGFNYSKINNYGRKYATGEYLLLLNNDTEVISSDWMEQLLMYAQREDVGAAGAKLYFPDGTIQHAGIVLGLGADRTAGHTHYGVPKQNLGYMGRLCYSQNVSAVTAACLMVSAKKFDEVGGLTEELAVALNDVDFCLKLRKKGYLNVFNAFAELYHYESKSRVVDSTSTGRNRQRYENEVALFKEKWKTELEAGDPYFNPNFSLDRADYFYVGTKNK